MDVKEILAHCDHTLLKQESTWAQIKEVCDDGKKYNCASICIPAAYVKACAEYVGNSLKICTVIGFPNGYSTTAVKVFETEDAIRNGADEIDMVINIGWAKDQRWDDILNEIKAIKASCQGRILKVIVETCLLTEAEKIKLCELVTASGADYIKTSTGFSTGGRGAVRQTCGPRRKDQGCRRHFLHAGCGGFSGPGRGPSGDFPYRQADKGPAGRRVLKTVKTGSALRRSRFFTSGG